jgi:hypothetical protein
VPLLTGAHCAIDDNSQSVAAGSVTFLTLFRPLWLSKDIGDMPKEKQTPWYKQDTLKQNVLAPIIVAVVLAVGVAGYSLLRGFVEDIFSTGAGHRLNITPRLVHNASHVVQIKDGATTRITFLPLTWAGLLLDIPMNVHSYRLEFDARLVDVSSSIEGSGWGYGVGVCDRWDGSTPTGFILQYALYEHNGVARPYAGRFAMPLVNDGRYVPIVVDGKIHHWSVVLQNGRVTPSIDFGPPFGRFPVTRRVNGLKFERQLPTNCDGADAFLRVFGTTAEFSNITVTRL